MLDDAHHLASLPAAASALRVTPMRLPWVKQPELGTAMGHEGMTDTSASAGCKHAPRCRCGTDGAGEVQQERSYSLVRRRRRRTAAALTCGSIDANGLSRPGLRPGTRVGSGRGDGEAQQAAVSGVRVT